MKSKWAFLIVALFLLAIACNLALVSASTATPPAAVHLPAPATSPASTLPQAAGPGQIYYVAPNGNDTNPGTIDRPWRTIGKAAGTLTAGDTVYIRAGVYHERVMPQNSGSAGQLITYAAYPGETATIDGTGITLPDDLAGLFEIAGRSYICLAGLRAINAGPFADNAAILVSDSDHITIENCATFVYGESDSTAGFGVFGYASATSGYTYGVWGESASPDGYAGYFAGRVHVTGNFSAGGSKSFKIDHPLDPANRYLYHFAQEGPEVQDVYNGVVTLDASGQALVALPAYFSALNAGPYRYQLTAIGAPMPNLYIAQEIQGHTFRIAGGVPGKKVSWEVTAVRHDPYLRDHPAQAEVNKPAEEQGTYLYPQGYGQPKEMGLDYQRNAALLERMPESPSAEGDE